MPLPEKGDDIEVKPHGSEAWRPEVVTRAFKEQGAFCVGKPKKEVWYSENTEGELWRKKGSDDS